MNAKEAMLCWNPDSAEVVLVPWPDQKHKSDPYDMTGLAAYSHVQDASFEKRKTIVFIEAMHLIVRDKVDPMAVHEALLNLDEYLSGCADDMSGVLERRR